MYRLISTCFLSLLAGVAGAHNLSANSGIIERLSHQVFGWHHLPLAIVLLLVSVAVLHLLGKKLQK